GNKKNEKFMFQVNHIFVWSMIPSMMLTPSAMPFDLFCNGVLCAGRTYLSRIVSFDVNSI
ncbi:MAG: hypothetical protein ACOCTM_03940, partial [Bacteroidota bacterium]